LCLAQETDPWYWDFYKDRKLEGDHIILDNGAYEGVKDFKYLRDKIAILEPQVAVLPDFPDNPWQDTLCMSIAFLDEYYFHFRETEWMFVPQARHADIVGWCRCLEEGIKDNRISWIGLPRMLATDYTSDPFIRARIAINLKRERPDLKLHALGMVQENGLELRELHILSATGVVESIDSHWPFKGGESQVVNRLEACGVNTNAGQRDHAQR